RRYARRDNVTWVTAPHVIVELSSYDVLTTEFIVGYSCIDILRATETKDAEALEALRAVDIDPRMVGRRFMQLALWQRLECSFFHADPHPGNIIVLPGNKLVMIDFGSCGLMSASYSAEYHEMSRRLLRDDVAGAVAVSLSMLAPLPFIDVTELQRRM